MTVEKPRRASTTLRALPYMLFVPFAAAGQYLAFARYIPQWQPWAHIALAVGIEIISIWMLAEAYQAARRGQRAGTYRAIGFAFAGIALLANTAGQWPEWHNSVVFGAFSAAVIVAAAAKLGAATRELYEDPAVAALVPPYELLARHLGHDDKPLIHRARLIARLDAERQITEQRRAHAVGQPARPLQPIGIATVLDKGRRALDDDTDRAGIVAAVRAMCHRAGLDRIDTEMTLRRYGAARLAARLHADDADVDAMAATLAAATRPGRFGAKPAARMRGQDDVRTSTNEGREKRRPTVSKVPKIDLAIRQWHERPNASAAEIAALAGVSETTAKDARRRLNGSNPMEGTPR